MLHVLCNCLVWCQLRRKTVLWDAPTPEALCVRGFLGPPSRVGWGKAAYNTLLRPVNDARYRDPLPS